MFVFMIILALFVIGLTVLIFKKRNSYTYMFVLKLVIINVFLMLVVLFVRKIENFQPVFSWEMSVYFLLAKIKVNYYLLFDLCIYCITAYLTISLVMAVSMFSFKKKSTLIAVMTAAAVPLLVFLYLNIYQTGVALHIALSENKSGFLAEFMRRVNAYNMGVLMIYTLLPFGALVYSFVRTKIRYMKRHVTVVGICMFTIDALAGLALWISPHKSLLFYAPNFLRTPSELVLHINQNYVVVVVVGMVMIGVFTYFAATKKIFDNIDLNFSTVRMPARNSKIYFKDMRPLCHTYKNILMSVDMMAKGILQKNPPDDVKEGIAEMRDVIGDALVRMTRMLDIYNVPSEIVEKTDIVECVKNAAKRAEVPENISVEITVPEQPMLINADGILLDEVFINLFKNSCEAIWQKPETEGRIDVEIRSEGNWSCTYFRDNGCGISKKDYAKVFKPLYSTKKTSENWGVGLSFVANVIMSIGGKILVRSKKGEYTEFEILLPIKRRRENTKSHKSGKKSR